MATDCLPAIFFFVHGGCTLPPPPLNKILDPPLPRVDLQAKVALFSTAAVSPKWTSRGMKAKCYLLSVWSCTGEGLDFDDLLP